VAIDDAVEDVVLPAGRELDLVGASDARHHQGGHGDGDDRDEGQQSVRNLMLASFGS
jgi:hypothetical protein